LRLLFFIFLTLSIGYPAGPVASYCDYESGSTTDPSKTNYYHYITGNNQEICNRRMLRSLEVLNANYAPSGIQFVLHSDYPNMLHATDPGFDGFYENATGGSSTGPSPNDIKAYYNIDNALNIYVVDFVNTRDHTYGISLFPWNIDANIPGAFFKHGFLPGDVDANESAEYDKTFMHEIGHYFGLLHINGVWYFKEGNTPRDLIGWVDCNEKGDTICDTPAEPGMSNEAWYTNSNGECIYHGYGGNYNSTDSTLQIGGYKQTFYSGTYPFYDYCEEWGIEDHHENGYFVMAFDNTDSPIPPGCGTLITFELEGVPQGLFDINAKGIKSTKLELNYFYNTLSTDITDGCSLPEMYLHITENGDVLYNSSDSISHFQFNIEGAKILGVSDGKAKDNNFHFQFDHCRQFTNYDNDGGVFGTSGLNSNECNDDGDQSEYSTECHIDNYSHLPIGHNFMRAASSPYNSCGLSPINDNDYFDETRKGFTYEQYANIRYFVEHCYTGCWDDTACNFDTTSTHLLRKGLSSCNYPFNGICDTTNDCLQPSDPMSSAPRSQSRNEGLDSITLSYQNLLSEDDIDCATDELYGEFTDEVWDNLIKIRKKVKQMINNNISRTILNTIYIPIVFHNLYKIETLSSNTTLNPINFEINQIYPNPFNPITTIHYSLNKNANVEVSIYDTAGRLITKLINEFQIAGYHSITWDASSYSSGIYFLNMSAGEIAETKKMVLIK